MKEKNKNHHMGKRTGYELVDGEYHIAPLYQQQFEKLSYEVGGIKATLDIVTSHAAEDLKEIARLKVELFKDIADDIGIDLKEGWVYSGGIIKKREVK